MFLMRFSIDVVFIDADWRVVRAITRVRPWIPAILVKKARSVIELPVGAVGRSATQAGDELYWEPAR
jgi:uncharacterized protein